MTNGIIALWPKGLRKLSSNIVAKHVVMRTNVATSLKLKNLRSTQFECQFICSIDLL
jgi:hypothetical protein